MLGFTALHCACWTDDVDTAAMLPDAGNDPNALDKHARTPLHHFDDKRLLDLMLGKVADVHSSDDEGGNPTPTPTKVVNMVGIKEHLTCNYITYDHR